MATLYPWMVLKNDTNTERRSGRWDVYSVYVNGLKRRYKYKKTYFWMVWKDDRNDSLLLRQSIHVPAQAWVVHKEGHDGLLSSSVRDDRVGASKGLIPEEVENARVLREGMYICLNVLVDKLGWNESVAAPVLLMKLWLKGKRGCPRLVGKTLAAMKAWLPASCWWNLEYECTCVHLQAWSLALHELPEDASRFLSAVKIPKYFDEIWATPGIALHRVSHNRPHRRQSEEDGWCNGSRLRQHAFFASSCMDIMR